MQADLAVHAEVLALREWFLVAAASRWASSYSLFESDLKSVVAWVADPTSAPWQFHSLLCECSHVFRSGTRLVMTELMH